MDKQEITLEELLKHCPDLDLRKDWKLSGGEPITAKEACEKIDEYKKFKKARGNSNIKNQTKDIGFDSNKLFEWFNANKDQMDELRIYISLDKPEKMFNVVLWPFKEGMPAILEKGGKKFAISPYNIGNRRP